METSQLFIWLLQYKYAIMLPLAIVEGPIVSIISGFLIHLGHLQFWSTYIILMAGDLIGDCVWYAIGRFWARPFINRYGEKFGFTPPRIEAIERIFKKHQRKTLLISKLTTGFGFAPITLMTAGSIGIPFGVYISLNIIGQLVWSGFLLTIGNFFGQFYVTIDENLRTGYMVVSLIVVCLALYLLQHAMKKRVTQRTV